MRRFSSRMPAHPRNCHPGDSASPHPSLRRRLKRKRSSMGRPPFWRDDNPRQRVSIWSGLCESGMRTAPPSSGFAKSRYGRIKTRTPSLRYRPLLHLCAIDYLQESPRGTMGVPDEDLYRANLTPAGEVRTAYALARLPIAPRGYRKPMTSGRKFCVLRSRSFGTVDPRWCPQLAQEMSSPLPGS